MNGMSSKCEYEDGESSMRSRQRGIYFEEVWSSIEEYVGRRCSHVPGDGV
jgi:hypothetical protein